MTGKIRDAQCRTIKRDDTINSKSFQHSFCLMDYFRQAHTGLHLLQKNQKGWVKRWVEL